MGGSVHEKQEIEAIRAFTVPTLANAIEVFGVVPNNEGFCNPDMICRFPGRPTMVGYAVTARVSTDQPASRVRPGIDEHAYWRFIHGRRGPKVAVIQDIDTPPMGAMVGEWNGNVHRALGCEGFIIGGAVRDLDGIKKLNIQVFSTHIHPSHGYGVFIDYSGDVRVGGLTVRTGDLIAGDRHGVIIIPPTIPLGELIQVAEEIDRLESEIFSYCQSPDFTVEGLAALDRSVMSRWPNPRGSGGGKKSEGR
jgi:regulator of RNase E activity RraA